jgi:hypothetical protein
MRKLSDWRSRVQQVYALLPSIQLFPLITRILRRYLLPGIVLMISRLAMPLQVQGVGIYRRQAVFISHGLTTLIDGQSLSKAALLRPGFIRR